jgi:hypothetical protein
VAAQEWEPRHLQYGRGQEQAGAANLPREELFEPCRSLSADPGLDHPEFSCRCPDQEKHLGFSAAAQDC